jgi:serine/threonine-protein kinase
MADIWTSLEGTFIGGRYEIQQHIATGGMAAILRGWDHRMERPVAIKVLRQLECADPLAVARFQREAETAAVLDHPNVVRVYDFFTDDDGCCYLIMEFIPGINLKQHLRLRGRLPIMEALAIAEQVCAALEAAHAHDFIHRDIKPQNILLDADGTARLTDFGIVHVASAPALTTGGLVLGTADYIAPEQARGEPLSPASDVYALGVVLYEMLTGRLPFAGPTPTTVAMQHVMAPVPLPSRLHPGLPRFVEAIVLRALKKCPEHRYRSAAAMGLALSLASEALVLAAGAEPPKLASPMHAGVCSRDAQAYVSGGAGAHARYALAAVGTANTAAPASGGWRHGIAQVPSTEGRDWEATRGEDERADDAANVLGPKTWPDSTPRAIAAAWQSALLVVATAGLLSAGAIALEVWLRIHGGGPGLLPIH